MKMSDLPTRVYVIEKGEQVPAGRRSKRWPMFDSARAMEVGDSMLVPRSNDNYTMLLKRATGNKFRQKVQDEHHIRVWRIA